MPAMSPTMTEGGIVQWAVKQGESYAAGDMLLEIETDKAQIAVEAQDDGIMAKILVSDGAKEIKVGTPIAVIADVDDDITAIDFDAILASAKPEASQSTASEQEPTPTNSATQEDTKPTRASAPEIPQNTVLLPSVYRLVHQLDVDLSTIKGTGPDGRILKGDVLAAAGKISSEWPAKEAQIIEKRTHLNLSYEAAPQKDSKSASIAKDNQPKPVTTQTIIDLAAIFEFSAKQGFNLEQTVAKASRLAIRDAILAAKPKPSVLRDRAFDSLTAPKPKVPFAVDLKVLKKHTIAQALQVSVTVPPQWIKRGVKMTDVYLERLAFYLQK